jgi:DNA-binding GntR family transcriptional regulator
MSDTMPELEPSLQLRRESTAEQVAGALRELIVGARLSAGTHLREGPLAAQLGVSRNTVREAVQILVGEGLVTREIHRGAYVVRLTAEDVRDLFRVRRLVEIAAVREIAGVSDTGSLAGAIDALAAASDSGDRTRVAVADLRCHAALVELMHSKRLSSLHAGVEAEMRLCIAFSAGHGEGPARPLEDHRVVLAAVQDGDSDAATRRLGQHLDEGEHLLLAAFGAAEVDSREAGSAA